MPAENYKATETTEKTLDQLASADGRKKAMPESQAV
jgi:hypothetical protein